MVGWIKLHRKISTNDLWLSEKFTRGQAWVDMLMLANHTDGFIRSNGMKINIKRGQIGWSEMRLSERWRWSRGKVRRFLSELEDEKMIIQQKNRRSPIVSVINYSSYQSDSTTQGTTYNTSNGQDMDKRWYTKKNDKKENNENNENKEVEFERMFGEFWVLVPKKEKKKKAREVYRKTIKSTPHVDVVAGLKRYIKDKPDWQAWAGPVVWLNEGRWDDEYEEQEKRIR